MIAWYAFLALLALVLLYVLHFLGRVREAHHGYWALMLLAVAPALHGSWRVTAVVVGLYVYGDEMVQHGTQAIARSRGEREPADFTPIHKLGSVIVQAWRDWRAA